jgi:hypothetical protein
MRSFPSGATAELQAEIDHVSRCHTQNGVHPDPKVQYAKACEWCGEPCFPAHPASSRARRTRCPKCKMLCCSYCLEDHRTGKMICVNAAV